jgi:hypothetical protein
MMPYLTLWAAWLTRRLHAAPYAEPERGAHRRPYQLAHHGKVSTSPHAASLIKR